MAERKLGAAVYGAGWVSGEHIKAYMRNPHCEVVLVGSRKLQSAKRKAAECGVECRCVDTFDQILEDKRVDIVSITTPNASHAELGIRAARAGKHILMEKPMCLTPEENRELRDEVGKAGVKSLVSFVLHWNPLFRIIKEQLADDAVGRIYYAEVDYFHAVGPWYGCYGWNQKKAEGGNSLLSAGCHAVDALRYFVGDTVMEVSAYSTRSDAGPFAAYEYDPTLITLLKFKGGAIGKVASCIECNSPYMFNILLMGDKGTIRDNHYYGDKCLGTHGHPEIGEGQYDWVTWPTVLPDSGDVRHHPFFGEIDELVRCILEDRHSHINIASAFETHEICFAAEKSAREGRPVAVPLDS